MVLFDCVRLLNRAKKGRAAPLVTLEEDARYALGATAMRAQEARYRRALTVLILVVVAVATTAAANRVAIL